MDNDCQDKFGYNEDDLDSLDITISRERLNRYLRLGASNRKKAILFYEMNNAVSESFFGVIRGLEVALRNSVHNALWREIGAEDWYDQLAYLGEWELDSIAKAKKSIRKNKKPIVPSRVISELTLGFWCGLTSKTYDAKLWVPHLHKAFPHKRLGRREANECLEQVRRIRNRIAHHECILDHNLASEYRHVIDAIGWICPATSRWVAHTSTLQARLQDLANLISPPVIIAVTHSKES